MRFRFLLASLLLPVLAFAAEPAPASQDDAVGIRTVTVDLEGVGADVTVGGASMSRRWLTSWTRNTSERRDVTLVRVGLDGRPGEPTAYHDCTLSSFTDFARNRADGIESIKIRCAR